MASIKSLVGQTLIYGLGTIVPRLLNYLLLTPFYTRIFDRGEYGSLTILYAYVAFLLVFLTYGMETTFFKFSESEDNKDKVFSTASWSMLFSTIPFALIIIFFNQDLADWMQYTANPNYILWLGLIVSLDVFFSIPFAKLRQQNKAARFTSIKLINITVNIGLNFLFLYVFKSAYDIDPQSTFGQYYSPEIGVGYVLIANLSSSAVVAILLLPELIKSQWTFDFQLWKKMMAYALPLLVVGLAAMINEVADKLLLRNILPDSANPMEQVGIYAANYKLAVLMTLFIQMFKYAAEPFFFKQAKEKNAKESYATIMKYFIVFGLSIFLGVTVFLDWIKFFIGSQFHEGLKVVPIVLMANLFLGIYYNLSVWYKLINKTHLGALISIAGAIVTLIINFTMIPKFGYMASAWATFAAYAVMMILSWIWGQRHYAIRYPMGRIALYFGLTVILYYAYEFLKFESIAYQNIFGAVLLIIFVSTAFLLEKKELKFL